jgi:hypothetical protein
MAARILGNFPKVVACLPSLRHFSASYTSLQFLHLELAGLPQNQLREGFTLAHPSSGRRRIPASAIFRKGENHARTSFAFRSWVDCDRSIDAGVFARWLGATTTARTVIGIAGILV